MNRIKSITLELMDIIWTLDENRCDCDHDGRNLAAALKELYDEKYNGENLWEKHMCAKDKK